VLGVLAAEGRRRTAAPRVADALDRIKSASTVELTTTGRKTGKGAQEAGVGSWSRTARSVVQAGKDGEEPNWYRNLTKTPTAGRPPGRLQLPAWRAAMVTDAQRVEAVHKLFTAKYTTAWLLVVPGLFDSGRGGQSRLVPVAVSVKAE